MPIRRANPIHKFINKPAESFIRRPIPPVEFRPHQNQQHPPIPRLGCYEILAPETFTIQPRTSFTVILKFGVLLRRGIVFVSLKQDPKVKSLSLQDGVVFETVDDIIVTIQNNSDVLVTISASDSICYVGRQLD